MFLDNTDKSPLPDTPVVKCVLCFADVTMCETSNLNPSGVGSSGVVSSSDYPDSIQVAQDRACTLTIHACANCRIQLTFTLLHLGSCLADEATFVNGQCMRKYVSSYFEMYSQNMGSVHLLVRTLFTSSGYGLVRARGQIIGPHPLGT